MGDFITATADGFAAVGSGTAVSAQTSFPVTYLSSYTTPNQPYKSSAAAGTAQRVTLDFGTATTLNAVMIDHTNVASVKIQGNATNAWTSPSYTATVTIAQDTLDGRYKVFHNLSATGFASTGYRYLSIQCNTSTTTFGGTVWIVGAVVPVATMTTWDTNTGPSHGRTRMQAIDQGQRTGGGAEPAALGNPYARIVIPAANLGTAMLATYDALMRAGEHQTIVFYRNLGSTAETYCCHRVGVAKVDYGGPTYLDVDQLVLEEYT